MKAQKGIPFYDFGRRLSRERGLIHDSVEASIDSGSLILGPSVEAFEEEFADFCGVSGAVGLGNGTDALELAIRSLMPAGGSAIVTVANAGGYASLAAARGGYRAVYWEIDPQSHVMDLNSLSNSLDSLAADGCGIVVFTHLYGSSTDLSELRKRCDLAGIRLIEDCAQATGSYSAAGPVGGAGHMGTFSFYPSKNLGAIGDAGAVVSRDTDLLSRVRSLRQYGWREKYQIINEGGVNSRMDSLQAEYLRRKLRNVPEVAQRRLEILESYKQAAPAVRFVSASSPGNVAHLAVLKTVNRAKFRGFLNTLEIESAVHYPVPDYLQKGLEQNISLSNTDEACNSVVSLPCNEFMLDVEVERVCDALAEWGADGDETNE